MLIESSPANLDPRIGTDAQSEHIDSLLFDALVRRNEHFGIDPELAERWDTPDPLTYVFHLRTGVIFHDGRPLTSRDVKWTLDSMIQGKIITVKAAAYASWASVDAPDPQTLIVHLKKPDNSVLLNLCDGAFGVLPAGSGRDFGHHPVGSGPFQFVSQEQDREVVLRRAASYWGPLPRIAGVRFAVVPDAITRALEMQKGSADVEINALPADMLAPLARNPHLRIQSGPGTVLMYTVFNTRDPVLRDARVRLAIADAINRPLIVRSLYGGHARLAESVLPPEHWAWTGEVEQHDYSPAAANTLLDQAGYPRRSGGMRFHLTIKTSTDETTRLVAVVMQQQLAQIGISLDVRSYEFATFYADIVKGAFQMAPSRWIGGNEAPDIFRLAFATASFPPHGANRGYYTNAAVDALLAHAASTADPSMQRQDYVAVQQQLARDLPVLNLWYLDTVAAESTRLTPLHLSPSGSFDFLREVSFVH
ncbi:MAG TPA: ABC transporter substrate-binding protein [Acidobacteriaceae bacterium]